VNKLQPGQRVTTTTTMWGLEWGTPGTVTEVAPDGVTCTFVPVCGNSYSYTLPTNKLMPATGEEA
jgi:hypothetical protein